MYFSINFDILHLLALLLTFSHKALYVTGYLVEFKETGIIMRTSNPSSPQ